MVWKSFTKHIWTRRNILHFTNMLYRWFSYLATLTRVNTFLVGWSISNLKWEHESLMCVWKTVCVYQQPQSISTLMHLVLPNKIRRLTKKKKNYIVLSIYYLFCFFKLPNSNLINMFDSQFCYIFVKQIIYLLFALN